MNLEHLFYKKKLCFLHKKLGFLHSLISRKNDVVSSVMEVFVRTEEYIKAYYFANVKPRDNKTQTIYCFKVKFADSIATDTNAVQ